MRAAFVVVLALCLGAPALSAHAAEPSGAVVPTRLTQDDALAAFHATGLERLLADAAVDAAEGDARAGAKLPNPNLALEAGPVFNYTPCAACWRFQLSAALTDSGAVFELLSGKHGAKSDAGRAALAAAEQDRAAMFRFLDAEVKQACIRVALARARLRFATEQNGYWVQGLEVQRLRATQVIDEGALARFEVQKAASDQAVVDTAAELRLAQASLGYLLGARTLAPAYEVDPSVLDDHAPASLANATEESLRARARAYGPSSARPTHVSDGPTRGCASRNEAAFPRWCWVDGWRGRGSAPRPTPPSAREAWSPWICLFFTSARVR